MKPAIFLDRDGVINKMIEREGLDKPDSPLRVEEFSLLPKSAEAIKLLNDKGIPAILISNQPGIAKGAMTQENLDQITEHMNAKLAEKGAKLDHIYYCPHREEDNCKCRKPKPGMIKKAVSELDIDVANSYMIGDSWKDIVAGKEAGCNTILLGELENSQDLKTLEEKDMFPDLVLPNLYKAVESIISEGGG